MSSFSFKYLYCHPATPVPDDSVLSPANTHLLSAHTLTYLLSPFVRPSWLSHVITYSACSCIISLLPFSCSIRSLYSIKQFPLAFRFPKSNTGYILTTGAKDCVNMLIETSCLQLDSSESVFKSEELWVMANLWCCLL